jgi:hypothetical protein
VSGPHLSSPAGGVVGWREWVGLPGVGVEWMKAKIDTGARTSSLHAFALEEFERADEPWVRFEIHPWQRSAADAVEVVVPVHDRRMVRSSSGHAQHRVVVLLDLRLLDRVVKAEVTLTRRDEMGFRMLIGREVLEQGYVVDVSTSYRGGRPGRAVRSSNRRRVHGA